MQCKYRMIYIEAQKGQHEAEFSYVSPAQDLTSPT